MAENKNHAANDDGNSSSGVVSLIKPSANDATSLESLVLHIKNTLTTGLTERISQLLETAQNKLFDMSDIADNNEDQARYFELMSQVRVLKKNITEDFINNVNTNLALTDISTKEATNTSSQQGTGESELSLVDQDDMEGIILVKGIGERSAVRYQEQLSRLEARLQHLSQKTNKAFSVEAITPVSFCQAFDDALANDFNVPNKKTLFSMFDEDIANKLDDIYDAINNSLIEADILPTINFNAAIKSVPIKHASPHLNSSTRENHLQQDTPSETQTEASPDNEHNVSGENISGFAMTASPGADAQHTSQNTGSYYGKRITDNSGQYLHQTAGVPASHVAQILSNYLGTSLNPAATNNSSDHSVNNSAVYPQSTGQHFGHDEVLKALSNIQNLPQFDQATDKTSHGEAIKQAIISEIAKQSGGAITKGINEIAEKTIDFIELIFDAIIEDDEISDTIKTLLLRLQIPIIKASMSDQDFFIYDDHPARELIDTIADVGVGITDHDDETYTQLGKIISDILSEHELNAGTFKSALDDLKAHIEDKEIKARAKEEEEQRQLLRKHARATILKSLRAATVGKVLPEDTHPLILKRWPTLMFNHYLANGKENDEWITIVLTLRRIVDSVQPIKSADDLARIQQEMEDLLILAEKFLNITSKSKKDVQDVMAAYRETIDQHIEDANFTKEEVSVAEKTISNLSSVEGASLEGMPPESVPNEGDEITKQEIPANIMPGMWFRLYMGEDKSPRRCKLSVILIEDASLMFVNHKGELIVEKTFDEFNQEVANETTFIIMGHSVFENAFKAVINRLN